MKTPTATVKHRAGAPDFVLGSFGFKAEDIVNFCNPKGYINFDLLKGKEGGEYVKINDYGVVPTEQETDDQQVMQFDDEGIPF